MKLTRHNGRSGKNGAYNPRHNDRRFDLGNSGHIDAERTDRNVYWDCYRGITTQAFRENPEQPDFSFEEVELMYYTDHYSDHVWAQNARNEKTRHTERNRTVEDLLKNNKTCPEETLFQIGTIEESVSPEVLLQVVNEFFGEFEHRFGTHVHILNWALHLDEGTPHIHERHVFDCENRYGELCPQQEKALEKLDIPLPQPDKPKGRNNNRKQMFDSICRALLFEVARRHGLHLEEEPSYGGRAYLEKQDFILMKQKEKMQEQGAVLRKQEEQIKDNTEQIEAQEDRISGQEAKIERLEIKLGDLDSLLEDVSNIAYETAVEIITDRVQMETHQEDIRQIEGTISWLESPERKAPKKERDYAVARLKGVISKIQKAMQPVLERIRERLMKPETKRQAVEQIKKQAKPSVLEKLRKNQVESHRQESVTVNNRKKEKKQNMELS